MRVLVMGSTGAGKSTFAARFAVRTRVARIEQDAPLMEALVAEFERRGAA